MTGSARRAKQEDIEAMVSLSDRKRKQYAQYSPVFWREAEDAATKQAAFFRDLLENPDFLIFVNQTEKEINGFIIGRMTDAPPVYDPGGRVCMIDDFVVFTASLWSSVGQRLLEAVQSEAKAKGAVLSVTICGHLDEAKRGFLQGEGANIASEWYVQELV